MLKGLIWVSAKPAIEDKKPKKHQLESSQVINVFRYTFFPQGQLFSRRCHPWARGCPSPSDSKYSRVPKKDTTYLGKYLHSCSERGHALNGVLDIHYLCQLHSNLDMPHATFHVLLHNVTVYQFMP